MQALSFGDWITLQREEKDSFVCSDPSLSNKKNLVCKAVELFRKKTNFNQPLKIFLKKNIPVMMGLGGGSSNAATILFALNQMAGSLLSMEALKELALQVGADVPFFFSLGTALCEGIGEKVRNLSSNPHKKLYLCIPKLSLETKKVYQQLKEPFKKIDPSLWEKGQYSCENDLEEAAFECLPKLKEFKEKLQHLGFDPVYMSGSGAAFFSFCKGKSDPSFQCIETFSVQRVEKQWYS